MSLFQNIKPSELFDLLYRAKDEIQIQSIIDQYPDLLNNPNNWHPFGQDENYFGVIESQQASPIPALVEKITNASDAILMKYCRMAGC